MASFIRVVPFVSLLAALPLAAQDTPPLARDVLAANGCPEAACGTDRGQALWRLVQAFYFEREARLVWVADGRLTPAGAAARKVVMQAHGDGLDPRKYDPREQGISGEMAEAYDLGLTFGLLRYAADLAEGRAGAKGASQYWRDPPLAAEMLPVLQEAAQGRPAEALQRLRPTHAQYLALAEALRRHRAQAAAGGWPVVATRRALRAGMRDPVVSVLRRRLILSADLAAPSAAAPEHFDTALAAAVRRFQERHGLKADGALDRETAIALNVPVDERIRQLEMNLERWRWQPRTAARREVLVNIPTFQLFAYEDGWPALTMRVITGKPDSPTPVFRQEMTHVIFSPYWNVPPNIAANETLPAVMRDRGYLRRNDLEVVRGGQVVSASSVNWRSPGTVDAVQFRQRPGAGNSLGGVKFLLPNPFHVYLHDTPNDGLFARARRALSHGCVRLERPEALARWALANEPGWTQARIRAAMRGGQERHVALGAPIPVTIAYFTAWVEESGAVQFRPDVYKHDFVQIAALDGTRSRAASSTLPPRVAASQ